MKKNIPWDLIISHLKKETTRQEEEVLQKWCEKEDNNLFFLELSSLWEEIREESKGYNPDTEYYWRKLEERITPKKTKEEKPSISLSKFRLISAVACVMILFSVSFSFFLGKKSSLPVIKPQTYTALNGKSQMTLPDGTFVWLNVGSTLTYQTSFLNKRTVQLEGEALFDVERDPESPFVVEVNDIEVKVLGTRFNVQAYPEKPNIRIALLEGKVSVLANEEEAIMNSGEIAYFDKESKRLRIENDDVVFESFWANRSCNFEANNLDYICRYLEKWYNVTITLDPDIANTHAYTFTITDEPLETILQIMSRINPIEYSFEEGNKVVIKQVK